MRDIRFRQAIFREGKFHHWHYWGYVGYRNKFVAPIEINQPSWDKTYEIKDSQQYIGLHAGELGLGGAIYEGDITKDYHGDILQVVWADHWARYMMSFDGKHCQYYLEDYNGNKPDCLAKNMEIIGNICETPKLLAKKSEEE